MIDSIKFKEVVDFPVSREDHYRFPVKHITPDNWSRNKEPYDVFELFPKGMTIKLKLINVIVGDNGSGKSTFLDVIKGYIGKPPDDSFSSFNMDDLTDEEREENETKERIKRSSITIKSKEPISYKNLVVFNAEKDNPAVAIPKMLNPDSKDFPGLVNQLFCSHEDSHGESLIPILDLLLTKVHDCVICMDEPETALSLKNQIRITNLIKESVEKRNTQIIICTHSLVIIQMFEDLYDMDARTWVKSIDYIKSIM